MKSVFGIVGGQVVQYSLTLPGSVCDMVGSGVVSRGALCIGVDTGLCKVTMGKAMSRTGKLLESRPHPTSSSAADHIQYLADQVR